MVCCHLQTGLFSISEHKKIDAVLTSLMLTSMGSEHANMSRVQGNHTRE